jgi:hypothetical protein
MSNKLCVIFGMCFAPELGYLLRLSEGFRRDFEVVALWTGGGRDLISDFHVTDEDLNRASVVVYHPPIWAGWGDEQGYLDLIARFPAHLKQITYPYPVFHSLWPFHNQDPRNKTAPQGPLDDINSLLFAYSDFHVLKMRQEGMPPGEIVDTYRAMDVPGMVDLDQLLEHVILGQRIKEEETTVKVLDFILERFRDERIFLCVNHGANRLMIHMADQILAELGYPRLPRFAHEALCELMVPTIPIHPTIIGHHGLRWARPDMRYQIDRRRNLTWEEYIYQLASDGHGSIERPQGLVDVPADAFPCGRQTEKEVSFAETAPRDIIAQFFRDGHVVLRNFIDPAILLEFRETLDAAHDKIKFFHVFNEQFIELGLPDFHRYLFSERHYQLLKELFGSFEYSVHQATGSRRVDSVDASGSEAQWMAPLPPHLDAYFHHFEFTVNFWVPLQPCGVDAPSLGVVRANLDEVLSFTGYDGNPAVCGGPGVVNFANFDPMMHAMNHQVSQAVEYFHSTFAERIVTPSYALGDAVMLSNWTLHFTHATPGMSLARRENVELRFWCDADIAAVRATHVLAPGNLVSADPA